MTFLPIVARELRLSARRRRTYLGRTGTAAAAVIVAGLLMPALAAQFSLAQGKALFTALSTMTFAYCLFAGARVTSDCLSSEKREGTIGLLFLTDLKGYDVILGKLVSHALGGFYALLATVPVLSLALLLGGVTLAEVGRTALLFVNTLFFSMATGVCVSTLSRDDRRAMFATICVLLLVTVAPFALAWGWILRQTNLGRPINTLWELSTLVMPSPLFPFLVLRGNVFTRGLLGDFYTSILITHVTGWAMLVIASLVVPRVCRERPAGKRGLRWLEFRNKWSYGKPAKRRAFRARLLDRNAFYWLAARDRIKAHYVWGFVGALGLIWYCASWRMESFMLDWDVSFCLLFLAFLFLKIWLTSEVCTRLVEDRAGGAFELLLSSPLDLRDLARGQSLALWRQFGWPVLVLLALAYLLTLSALRAPHSGMSAAEVEFVFFSLAAMLVADMLTLKWTGMWHAVFTNQVNRAMTAVWLRVLLLPTVVFLLAYGALLLFQQAFISGGNNEASEAGWVGALWLGIGLVTDLFFGLTCRWRFLHQFREAATQRYVPAGPGVEPFLDALRKVRGWFWARRKAGQESHRDGLRWARWTVGSCALLLVIAVFGFGVWRHSLSKQVASELERIKVKGEPVTLAAFKGWTPMIPDKENAALIIQKAMPYILTFRGYHPRKLDWPGRVAPLAPELKAMAEELVNTNRHVLDLLHGCAALTKSRFPLDWRGPSPRMAQWQVLSVGTALPAMRFDALLCADQGDADGALKAIATMIGIARALGQEPFVQAQQERSVFLHAAISALERMLNQQALNPDQLNSLAASLREAEATTGRDLEQAMIGERCFGVDEMRFNQGRTWGAPANGAQQVALAIVQYGQDVAGMPDLQLLDYLARAEWFIAQARQTGAGNLEATLAQAPRSKDNFQMSTGRPREDYFWADVFRDQTELCAKLRVAHVALAIEQLRLAHQGALPEKLWPFLTGFIPGVPGDPFGTGPLSYKTLSKGYVVYSIGRDGKDDGGKERPSTNRAAADGFDITFTVER